MAKLRIAAQFDLPLDAVTTSDATFGIRGSGKTNTNVVMVEELLECEQQVAIVDPTDVWWGIKSSRDGKKPGYHVLVLGGRHADVPLGAGDGNTIADFVVDERVSVIMSLRHFESDAEKRRFVTDFARRLYHRKGQSDAPTPIKVIFDEASLVAPQRVLGEDARMVGAIQRLVRQGRSSGIGVGLIDARPATVNKDVLAGVEMIVTHRITSPQDRKALLAWVEQHDAEGQAKEFLESLASLQKGEAWFWSPGWLDVFEKVSVRQRRTYDSSYTPKAGEVVFAPTTSAELDLVALQAKLGATIEKARAEDPRELQQRVRTLESEIRRLRTATPAAPDPAAVQAQIELAVEHAIHAERERQERLRRVLRQACEKAQQEISEASSTFSAVLAGLDEDWMPLPPAAHAAQTVATFPAKGKGTGYAATILARVESSRGESNGDGGTSGPGQRILDAIAFYNSIGVRAPAKTAIAAFVGVSPKTGSWANRLSELRTAGLIQDPSRDAIALTAAGAGQADQTTAPRSLAELHDRWLGKVSSPAAKILRILIEMYPDAIDKSALAAMVGVSPSTGSWANRLSELRVPGLLVDTSRSEVCASANLFPQGLS